MRNLMIVALCAALVFTCYRLILVENQRYAMLVGLCQRQDLVVLHDIECLKTVETRTSWTWNLYYGLFGKLPV